MTTTAEQLINVSIVIGGIAESNGHYTDGLSRIIEASGKDIMDLTVCELLHLARNYNETFNRIHGN